MDKALSSQALLLTLPLCLTLLLSGICSIPKMGRVHQYCSFNMSLPKARNKAGTFSWQ